MSKKQLSLVQSFTELIDALRDNSLGSDDTGKPCAVNNRAGCKMPNLRLGVVSTDLGTGGYPLPSCEVTGGDRGLLQHVPRRSGCVPPTDPWIEYTSGVTNVPTGDPDPIQRFKDAFSCIGRLGVAGCGFEQPLEAARIALDPAAKVNRGFQRKDALLAIVMISNEDDCSASDPSLFAPSQTSKYGSFTSFRCFEFGMSCDVGGRQAGPRKGCVLRTGGPLHDVKTRYAEFFSKLRPAGRVVLSVIAGPTTKVNVSNDNGRPKLDPSCGGPGGEAAPAFRLAALAKEMGFFGNFSSICGDFGPPLAELGQAISSARGLNCLRSPKDSSPAPGLQVNCQVAEVDQGNETTIAACSGPADRCDPCPCWHTVAEPQCRSGYGLHVIRKDRPTALIRARCESVL